MEFIVSATYTDTGVINGTAYYYKVSAVNPCGESLLSVEQFGTPASLLTDLLAYWTLNESSGNRADSSGNGHTLVQTGTITGAAGFGNVGPVSVWDDSQDDFLASGAVLSGGAWTVAGWVNLVDHLNLYILFTQGPSAGSFQQVIDFTATSRFGVCVDGSHFDSSAIVSAVNVWTHVAVTYDGVTVKLYANGTLLISAARTAVYSGADECALGAILDAGSTLNALNGSLGGWGIWGRVLSATGIANLYNTGNGQAFAALGSLAG